MEYTIGDVLTVIGVIVGVYVSIWALVVGSALAFPRRAERAERHLRTAPWVSIILGAALFVLGMTATIVLLRLQNPLTILMGWAAAGAMIAAMVVGGSGLALVMGQRIQQMDRRCSPFRGLTRSAWIMVMAVLIPGPGWAVAGVAALASLGAGFQALLHRTSRPIDAAVAPPLYAGIAQGQPYASYPPTDGSEPRQ